MAKAIDNFIVDHLERLEAGLISGYDFTKIPKWIEDQTRLQGKKFSFKGHEYQLQILNDRSRNINVRKCSQVGISELSARLALAETSIIPGFTVIYTLPTATFAETFVKTRVDPIIADSPKLKATINSNANNTGLKQFGSSFIYFKGTQGAETAISIPADHIISDELDFSDLEVVTSYQSRLPHSKYKLTTKFSTPTRESYGISSEMSRSRRFYNFCKCHHCNHQFVPNYFTDVKVKGWDNDLKLISKDNIETVDYRSATLHCPKCGKVPDLGPDHRQWVVENASGDIDTAGYQISPFDAPSVISSPDLVIASTRYKRYADFINFSLGLPAEDSASAITGDDLEKCWIHASGSGYVAYVMGIDVGITCHIMVAGVKAGVGLSGGIDVVHTETVLHTQLEARKEALQQRYPTRITVCDSMPYFDLLIRMQQKDHNMWGSLFNASRDLDVYKLRSRAEEADVGQSYIRQVDINRNKGFDMLMEAIRSGQIHIMVDVNQGAIRKQCTDMSRLRLMGKDHDFSYVWRRSEQKNDHFHHTLLYAFIASKLTGLAANMIQMPLYIGKMKTEVRL